jgi:hypothetical protein
LREERGVLETIFATVVEHWRPPAREVVRPDPAAPVYRPEGSVIQRLARVRDRTGIPIALVQLEFEDAERPPIDLEVEAEARAHAIPYLDTRDPFRGTRASDFWIYELDPHPNWRAHEVFARTIDAFLRSNGLLAKRAQP